MLKMESGFKLKCAYLLLLLTGVWLNGCNSGNSSTTNSPSASPFAFSGALLNVAESMPGGTPALGNGASNVTLSLTGQESSTATYAVTITATNNVQINPAICTLTAPESSCTIVVVGGSLPGNSTLTATANGAVAATKIVTINSPQIIQISNANNGNLALLAESGGSGIDGADALCNSLYPGYKAVISDGIIRTACESGFCDPTNESGINAIPQGNNWVLDPNTPYITSNGTLIAYTNQGGVFAWNTVNPLSNINESAWTGLNSNWTSPIANTQCSDGNGGWNTSASESTAQFGNPGSITSSLIFAGVTQCNNNLVLMCAEQ